VRRGDLITVAVSGDYCKPRPALVIQSDLLPETDSVLVCLLTMTVRDAPLYRLDLPATEGTGLREASQVMVDKITAARRNRCGPPIGRVDERTMAMLGRMLGFVVGLAD
jgi:mRNA interferase MazF